MSTLVYRDYPQIGKGFRISTNIIPAAGLIPVLQAAREGNRNLYRYSKDGGQTFTDWEILTTTTLAAMGGLHEVCELVVDYVTDPYKRVEYRSRMATPLADPLSTVIYDKSVFKQFFENNDPQVLAWALNVLEKLYEPGIVPLYIKRDNEADYTAYFFAITHFFAFIVIYARKFRFIENDDFLMQKFIEGWGLVYENIDTPEQRSFLFKNWIKQFSERGTFQITQKQAENEDGEIIRLDGELRRLVGYSKPNEFIFGALAPQDTGWCMGWSSPTWDGTETVNAVSKGYDFGPDYSGDVYSDKITFGEETITLPKDETPVNNTILTEEEWLLYLEGNVPPGLELSNVVGVGKLEEYPIVGSVERKMMDNRYVLVPTGSGRSGVDSQADTTKVMEVYRGLNYEITVWVKALNGDEYGNSLPQNIEFGVNCYNGNMQLRQQVRLTDFQATSSFFLGNRYQSPCLVANKWYRLKGIIYNIVELKDEDLYLNFLNGRPLRFIEDIRYMAPYLVQNRSGNVSDIAIGGIVLKPLSLPFTQGYLGQKNVIAMYAEIRSARTKADIESFIKRYLVSYKNVVSVTWLDWVVRTSWFATFYVSNTYNGAMLEGAKVTVTVRGGAQFVNSTDENGYVRFEVPVDSIIDWTCEYRGVTSTGFETMKSDKDVYVRMTVPLNVSVEIVEPGFGTVVVTPEPPQRLPRTEINLTATPAPGYAFLRWEIAPEGAVDTRNPTVYQLGDVDIDVKAIFEVSGSLSFSPAEVVIPQAGGSSRLIASSNVKWAIDPLPGTWVSVTPSSGDGGDTPIEVEIIEEG